jgi:hypothetical protein
MPTNDEILIKSIGLTAVVITPPIPDRVMFRADIVNTAGSPHIGNLILTASSGLPERISMYPTPQIGDDIQHPESLPHISYPRLMEVAAMLVVMGTIGSMLIGYFLPGPITGVALAFAITSWWVLYRVIANHDKRVVGFKQWQNS